VQIILLAHIATVNCFYSHAVAPVYTNGVGGAQMPRTKTARFRPWLFDV